jgi:membrane protein DedA with SNARE-associated domain
MHHLSHAADLPLVPLCLLLIGLIFIEADAVIVFIGVLIHRELFPLVLGVSISLAAGFANDYLWYRLGRHLRGKDHSAVAWMERVTKRANVHVQAHPFKAIFLTKFMYGIVAIHRATLVRCGMNHLSFKKFFVYNGLSVVVWVALLIGFGYFGSDSISQVNSVIKIIELSCISLVVLSIIIWKLKKVWMGQTLHKD